MGMSESVSRENKSYNKRYTDPNGNEFRPATRTVTTNWFGCSPAVWKYIVLAFCVAVVLTALFHVPQRLFCSVDLHKIPLFMGNSSSQVAKVTSRMTTKLHIKCRGATYPRDNSIKRFPVKDEFVPWNRNFLEYAPVDYTAPSVASQPVWADLDYRDPNVTAGLPKWNELDGKVDRRSHEGKYDIDVGNSLPKNPRGRTGIIGRGCLGRWGPNHAADPIVTKWKRTPGGEKVVDKKTNKPILQFIAIQRRDSGEWAIPGGMVDPGEAVSITLKREFGEEALNMLEVSPEEKKLLQASVNEMFSHGIEGMVNPGEQISITLKREFGEEALNSLELTEGDTDLMTRQINDFFAHGSEVYRGYVDDPRNTDNSWMETVAYNFHDENGKSVGRFKLHAGDDAVGVRWTDLDANLKLFASHVDFIHEVAKRLDCHWE